MSYLYNLQCVLPPHKISQENLLKYMLAQYPFTEDEKAKLSLMYRRSGIENRYSCIPDFEPETIEKELFIGEKEPGISERMSLYFKKAVPLLLPAAKNSIQQEKVTHLISVSCTGMAAPGLDLMLCKQLQLPNDIARSSINFMGCYALFHALKMADYICKADPNAKVLIAGVELCTLHFNKLNTPDQLAANLLFGDGAATCLVSGKKPNTEKYFTLSNFYSLILPKGEEDMAWRIEETSFLMTLSSYIPQLIEEGIASIVTDALEKKDCIPQNITHWAFHPGGRKILDKIASELNLSNTQLQESYSVLKEVGNLSSVTLLFVLDKILQNPNYQNTQRTFSAGFGPGLTIETLLLNC